MWLLWARLDAGTKKEYNNRSSHRLISHWEKSFRIVWRLSVFLSTKAAEYLRM